MGNVCCSGKEERNKSSVLLDTKNKTDIDDIALDGTSSSLLNPSLQQQQQQQQQLVPSSSSSQYHDSNGLMTNVDTQPKNENLEQQEIQQQLLQQQQQLLQQQQQQQQQQQLLENERYRVLREEQARLERIVQETARGMVSIRSTRGSTGYYDQGFVAALWQHLEQTSAFTPIIGSGIANPKLSQSLMQLPLPTPALLTTSRDINTNNNTNTNATTALSATPNSEETRINHEATTTHGITSNRFSSEQHKDTSVALLERLSLPMWEYIDLREDTMTSSSSAVTEISTPIHEKQQQQQNYDRKMIEFVDHIAESYLESALPSRERIFDGTYPIIERLL